jgi:hypothetical protein
MIRSRFLGTKPINGTEVSFFSPPHDGPDFLWVDVKELAMAFLPEDQANRMVGLAQSFGQEGRAVETTTHQDRIVTIAPLPIARGMCDLIDRLNGYVPDETSNWLNGPCALAYVVASSDAQFDYCPLGLQGIGDAFKNQGGPYMRDFR